MNIRIRVATNENRDDVRDIYLQAFPEEQSHLVAELADSLLDEESDPATVTLVAEMGGEIVGHVDFSPVYAGGQKKCLGYILAPLAVKPKYHNMGIGSKLVEGGIARLSKMGINLFLVYGDPKYYDRFGFKAEAASIYLPPYNLKYPFGWLAMVRSQKGASEQVVQLSCLESLRNPELW